MIKVENGQVEMSGSTPQLMTELQFIIRAFNENDLKGVKKGENKEIIMKAVNDGLTPIEELIADHEDLKRAIENISSELDSVFEELAQILKGTGEK